MLHLTEVLVVQLDAAGEVSFGCIHNAGKRSYAYACDTKRPLSFSSAIARLTCSGRHCGACVTAAMTVLLFFCNGLPLIRH